MGLKTGGPTSMAWAATWRALGPATFVSYAVSRLIAIVPGLSWRRYRLIAVPRIGLPTMPRGYSVRRLDELEIFAHASDIDLPHAAIHHRLQQRMTCLGAFRNGRLLGVTWIIAGSFLEDEVRVHFAPAPGAAWDTGLYVRPEDRTGRAFAALWAGTAEWLDCHDLDWSMSRIADINDGSWRAHARLGAKTIGMATALRIGRHQWMLAARPRHIRLDHPEAPVLSLELPDAD